MEPVKMIGIKLDRERDDFARTKAAREKRTVTSVLAEGLDLLHARILIQDYITANLEKNMVSFATAQDFGMWCDRENRTPARPVQVHFAPHSMERYVLRETYRTLEEWHAGGFEPSFLNLVAFQREHWLPVSFLTEAIPFDDEGAIKAPPPRKARKPRSKAEVTA